MPSTDRSSSVETPVRDFSTDRRITIGISLMICIIFAGVIGIDYSNQVQQKTFDPRASFASHCASDPMDETYPGYVPHDAVIPAQDGIYLRDEENMEDFKKVPGK